MEKRKLTVDNSKEQQISHVSAMVETRQGVLSFSLEGNGCLEGVALMVGVLTALRWRKGASPYPTP